MSETEMALSMSVKGQADRRRRALVDAGCCTYIVTQQAGRRALLCVCCGLITSLPGDVLARFCSFCGVPHAEWRIE